MVKIGQINTLKVMREADFGLYLDGGEFGGILLPRKEVPEGAAVGDELSVFILLDTDDFVVATTRAPMVQVGEFASLQVVEVNKIGAFLNWGMPKDLLLPYGEQRGTLEAGKRVVVGVYVDNSDRIAATTKLDKLLSPPPQDLKVGQPVELLVCRRGDLGYSVIVDNSYWALLHQKDVFRTVRIGHKVQGYIKRVVDGGKVDVVLDKPGFGKVDELSQRILDDLAAQGGVSPLGDKSQPEAIYQAFGVSKKAYKMAIGHLKKLGRIDISPEGIKLLDD